MADSLPELGLDPVELGLDPVEESSIQDFSKVVFQSISPTYPEDAAVECQFQVSEAYKASPHDWVGLFQVGWMTPREYIYYEWVPMPGDDRQGKIVFQAQNLPEDDGEFYQFCYVASGWEVLGASTPFQFRKPAGDDFVEEEEESDDDMMVVYPKKDFLQKELDSALARESLLEEKIQELERDLRASEAAQKDLRKELDALLDENEDVLEAKEDLEVSNSELKKEVENLILAIDEMNKKLEVAEAAKDNFMKEQQSLALQYQDELDAKDKKIRILESVANEVMVDEDNERRKLNAELQKLQACNLDLEEKLRNAKNLYEAAETSKKLLYQEVSSYREAHQKLSTEYEMCKSENFSLRESIKTLQASKLDACNELDSLLVENRNLHMARMKLEGEKNEVTTTLKEHIAAGTAVRTANRDLQQRLREEGERSNTLERRKKNLKKKLKALQEIVKELETRLQEGKREYLDVAHMLERSRRSLKKARARCPALPMKLPKDFKIHRCSTRELTPGCLRLVLVGKTDDLEASAALAAMQATRTSLTEELTPVESDGPQQVASAKSAGPDTSSDEASSSLTESSQQVEEAQPRNLPRPLSPVPAPRTRLSDALVMPRRAAEPEEEKFEDARGEGMQVCLECGATFGPEQDAEYMEHLVGHVGEICPHCKAMKDDSISDQQFRAHVCNCNPDFLV